MENSKRKDSPLALIAIFLGFSCVYIDKYVIGISVVPIAAALGFDPSQKGLLLSAFFLGYTIMQIPMGYLSNKIGTKPVLVFSIVMVGVFLAMFGLGISLAFLVAVRFMTGFLAHSGYPSSVTSYIAQEIPQEKRGFAQSTMLTSSGLAAFIGPLMIAPLLANLGWQKTYYVMGAAVVLVGVFMFLVIPKRSAEAIQMAQQKKSLPFSEVLKDKLVWIITIVSFFMNAAIYGLMNWTASYLNDPIGRNLPMDKVSYISAIGGVCLLITGIFGGYLIGKFFVGMEKRAIFITSLLGCICIYGVYAVQNLLLAIVLLCLSNMLMIIAFTTLMSLPHKMFQPDQIAVKYAAINAGGVFGGFFAPMIMGFLLKSTGSYQVPFLFLGLIFVLSGALALIINKKYVRN